MEPDQTVGGIRGMRRTSYLFQKVPDADPIANDADLRP